MTEEKKEEKEKVEIEVSTTEEIKRGVFSNRTVISHFQTEFFIDFLNITPSGGTLNSRVIVTPLQFKKIVKASEENLRKYEERFGEIPDQKEDL